MSVWYLVTNLIVILFTMFGKESEMIPHASLTFSLFTASFRLLYKMIWQTWL